jgi:hypothetical protein
VNPLPIDSARSPSRESRRIPARHPDDDAIVRQLVIQGNLLSALVDVVEKGTAVRAKGSVLAHDGTPVTVGRKTGTGDNRC